MISLGAAVPGRAEIQQIARLPGGAVVGGAIAPATTLTVTVALAPRDPAALAHYAAAVATPGSGLYRRDLTTAQFARRFGAAPASSAAVRAVLSQAGLSVGATSPDGLSLPVRGSARRVARAFDTALRVVTLRGGRVAFTDTVAPSLPADVAPWVVGVIGLDTTARLAPEGLQAARRTHATSPASAHAATGASGPQTCAAASADAAEYGANTAAQIGHAYGLDGLWAEGDLGAGTTVAVYELEPFSTSDITTYDTCAGISPTLEITQIDGGAGTGAGSGEAALDIEDIAGLAPAATVDVYEGPNSGTGPTDTMQTIVDDDTAKVISTSWGTCEANESPGAETYGNELFEQAATQGQVVLAAAGDHGADDCEGSSHAGTAAVDVPASQPFVTGVGGTSMAPGGSPAAETVWNDGNGNAGGGGASSFWVRPSWQTTALAQTRSSCSESPTTAGGNTTASTHNCREVPDVAADADPQTGYVIDYDGQWTAFGGTSAAAPTWAGLVALADSSSYCAHPLGFLNPTLYGLPQSDFYDVTSGSNGADGVTGYAATTGYDMASGLGAPDGAVLIPALCGASPGTAISEPTDATTTTTTTPSPTPTSTPPPTVATPSPGNSVISLSVPARVRARVGVRVTVRLRARVRAGLRLSYTARHLPPGLHISLATGVLGGRPRRAGHYRASVRAIDSAGEARSAVIVWTIAPPERRRHR